MGVWGTGIFQDDTASDIRDEYKDLLGEGTTGEHATRQLLKSYAGSLADPDESGVVWLALAGTQWKLGRLEPATLEQALRVIDSGSDLKRWTPGTKDFSKRKAALEHLRAEITSPQPTAIKIKRRILCESPWQVGDLFAWRLPSENVVLFRVIDHYSDKGGKYPLCEILDWVGKSIPAKEVLMQTGIRTSREDYKHKIAKLTLVGLNRKWSKRIQNLDLNLTPFHQGILNSVVAGTSIRFEPNPSTVIHFKTLDKFLKEWFLIE